MYQDFFTCPRHEVAIDVANVEGPLETWRHALGQGGVNHLPLPEHVVAGVAKLGPKLIRIFIQQFFDVYPQHGRFDWSRLDPYMDALARTGAKVVAAITIKPPPLFPNIDQTVWRPNDVAEWQRVVAEMVRRYSVQRPIVTHWEVGNEVDIGEMGGCPYLVQNPDDYFQYYKMTTQAVLGAFPAARVGGPGNACLESQPLPGLVELCRRSGTRLDFLSWHLYSDDPAQHAALVAKARAMLDGWPGQRPEMMVTEMNKFFDAVSVPDLAMQPRRAAAVGAAILAMMRAGLDWSFYYHIWDQTVFRDEFARFFARPDEIMTQHWNEIPHRFGLFGVGGEFRPQYFLYQMLSRLGREKLAATCDCPDLHILAGRSAGGEGVTPAGPSAGHVNVLLVNYGLPTSADRVVSLRFSGLFPCRKTLTTYRIDHDHRWDSRDLELLPLETREVDTPEKFHCQIFSPADTVTTVKLGFA